MEERKITFSCENLRQQIRHAALAWTTVILILGLTAIGSYTGISLYNTYTTNKQIESALEYAKKNNNMIKLNASNSGSCALNITAGNSQSATLKLMQGSAVSITVYPKGYMKQYVKPYPNGATMEPYSLGNRAEVA